MADISSYLEAINDAVYGEEVRGSIHDAIEAIDTEVTESLETADGILSQLNAANATAAENIEALADAETTLEEITEQNTTAAANITDLSAQNETATENIEGLTEANENATATLTTINASLDGLTFVVNDDDGTVTVYLDGE